MADAPEPLEIDGSVSVVTDGSHGSLISVSVEPTDEMCTHAYNSEFGTSVSTPVELHESPHRRGAHERETQ